MIKQLKFLNQKLNYMNQSFTNHALRPRPHSRLPQYLDHPKEGREGRQAGRQAGIKIFVLHVYVIVQSSLVKSICSLI